MTDSVIIVVLALFFAVVVFAMMISRMRSAEKGLSHSYISVCVCLLGWIFFLIAFRISQNFEVSKYLDNIPFVFISSLPVALLSMTMHFYGLGKKVRPKILALLCVIPAMTSIVAVSPPLHPLLRTVHVVTQVKPVHLTEIVWGPWFYVHGAYSYIILMACVVIVLVQHFKQPSGYILASGLLVTGICITILGNILTLLQVFHTQFDITLLFCSLTVIFLSFAVANSPTTEYLAIARQDLFNFLDESIFMLNKERMVIDLNISAKNMLEEFGYSPKLPFPFEDVVDTFVKNGASFSDNDALASSKNLFLPRADENIVYMFNERLVLDKRGKNMGYYASLLDITKYDKIIKQLKKNAEIDPLTGMANRRAYDIQRIKLDVPESLPLSVIIGDVNGLKIINDSFGHGVGDIFLCHVAKAIQNACPPNAVAARIGGDEFVVILPCCTGADAQELIDKIEQTLALCDDFEQKPSIAFGLETKINEDENLEALIALADQRMYQTKKYNRRVEERN